MEPSENSEDGGLVVAGTCQQAVQTYPTHPPGNSRRMSSRKQVERATSMATP